MDEILGILGSFLLLLPAIGAVIGIVLVVRSRREILRLRWWVTIISLMAIVAENIYFVVVVFALLPDRAGPGYSGLVYQSHKRLEVLGVRSLFAVLALAFLGTGIGRGIAIAGAIVLFFIWVGTGIKP